MIKETEVKELDRLDIPVPPMLEEALGYSGKLRWVAFYWTPAGDELVYNDGITSADSSWHAWLCFKRHPRVAPHLKPYHLGNSEYEAKHWLLLDRETRTLYAGKQEDIEHFLILRAPPLPHDPDTLSALIQNMSERWSEWAEQTADQEAIRQRVEQRMEKEARLVKDLEDWLSKSKEAKT